MWHTILVIVAVASILAAGQSGVTTVHRLLDLLRPQTPPSVPGETNRVPVAIPRAWDDRAVASLPVGCGRQSPAPTEPEIVLSNGRIFTGTQAGLAEAVRVRGSRIAAIGPTQEVSDKAGPTARHIDLMGRLVIPCINDAHLHLDFFLPEHTALRFDAMDPPCSVALDRVRDVVRTAPKDKPIIGAIGQTAFFETDCTAQTLDRFAPEPAVVIAQSPVEWPEDGVRREPAPGLWP